MHCNDCFSSLLLNSSASPSTPVVIAICTLPAEFSNDWNKTYLGDQIVTNVANLLKSSNGWKCNVYFYPFDSQIIKTVPGNVLRLHKGPATLSMACRVSNELVSSMYKFHSDFHVIKCMC